MWPASGGMEMKYIMFSRSRYPEEKSKDFSQKKKYSRILIYDKNVDRTFSRHTKMSTGHLVENQNIDRNNIEGSKIQKERTQNAPKQQGWFVQVFSNLF